MVRKNLSLWPGWTISAQVCQDADFFASLARQPTSRHFLGSFQSQGLVELQQLGTDLDRQVTWD